MISAFGVVHKAMKLSDGSWVRFRTKTSFPRQWGQKISGTRRTDLEPVRTVEARQKGKTVAYLEAATRDNFYLTGARRTKAGEIQHVMTRRKMQRKGIATAMMRHARRVRPEWQVEHGPERFMTSDGRAWARGAGS